MTPKLKPCAHCNELKIIWKNDKGKRYCQQCWSQVKPTSSKTTLRSVTPLKKFSDKQQKKNQLYAIMREQFFKSPKNHLCKANLPGCQTRATDVHHLYSGADRGDHMLDFANVIPVCRSCHGYIHDKLTREEAIALGLKKVKTNETEDSIV
jgi:hypothetical protein